MMNSSSRLTLFLFLVLSFHFVAKAQDFPLAQKNRALMIVYSREGPKLDSITAHLLAEDIQRATGNQSKVVTDINDANGNVIVIGNIQSKLVQKFIGEQSSLHKNLQGRWECFALKIIDKPSDNISKAFVIAGSDARGTAYGVFTLSEKIGVSPWYWWADVPVKQQSQLIIHQPEYISSTPSVKFRGIFINDEDWGLRPWAATTFEPEVKNIGPKTYAKVFELLLRLKANLIWPAMHPGTTAFYAVPGNKEVASLYSIVIGSSHAEPMLRNNVGEWDEKTMGPFNYITNREKVDRYWESRVKESSGNDVIYTIGMRGVHDGQMEGVKTAKEAVPLLEQIFKEQRELLKKYNHKDVTEIPQVFTPYKEVLEFYDNGLKVPDDVTLVWPDDNYGYIQRLSTDQEKKRSGGAGVYYHASYWGRPHDYLWLSTTHPSLIREEMVKAYETGANRLWVLNVGDIKPQEYDIQFFLDMAYDAKPFMESSYTQKHLLDWNQQLFGSNGKAIADVLRNYYNLAFERRPEFMGWSQTEPTTNTHYTDYNHFYYGDEAQRRIDAYNVLEKAVDELKSKTDSAHLSSFYELVYYPVIGAAEMNKKFLYHDKAYLYAKQNRISAYDYASMSGEAYHRIEKETEYFNTSLQNGKWSNMMSMKPRDLPVFDLPALPSLVIQKENHWSIAPERMDTSAVSNFILPTFTEGLQQTYFIDIFLSDSITVQWNANTSASWITLSEQSGILSPERNKNQARLWVNVDWTKAPRQEQLDGQVNFSGAGKQFSVMVHAFRPKAGELKAFKGFVEANGYVSMWAQHYASVNNKPGLHWEMINGLGHTGASMTTTLSSLPVKSLDTTTIKQTASYLSYDFFTFSDALPQVVLYGLPTLPLNKNYRMRFAFCIDEGLLQIGDFTSNSTARTEEWKQNVLSNTAVKKVTGNFLKKGKHTLKIFSIDPGIVLDRVVIDLGGMKNAYSVIPETR